MSDDSISFDHDPERRRFLEIAWTALVQGYTGRLKAVPTTVAERAYDLATDTILRRAINGVEEFRDERGEQCPPKIFKYVATTLGFKIASAHSEQPPTGPYLDEIGRPQPATDDADELEEQRRFEDAVERANRELEEIRLRDLECDERRLRHIAQGLLEHGVKTHAQAIVLARATRAWTHDVTAAGVSRRYRKPSPWRVIAEELGTTSGAARQAFLRAMRRLSAGLRALVEEPASFDG